jgi:DNA-binding PadR family transcriptional regulator
MLLVDQQPEQTRLRDRPGHALPHAARLEQQGLLKSEWRVEDPRPRRYYQLNDAGREMLALLKAEWQHRKKY